MTPPIRPSDLYSSYDDACAKLTAAKAHLNELGNVFLANESEENASTYRLACYEVEQLEETVRAARMALAGVGA